MRADAEMRDAGAIRRRASRLDEAMKSSKLTASMLAPRSLLFVPGSAPKRFATALTAGADAMCVDLEDAVAFDAKESARGAAVALLREARANGVALGVRINTADTSLGQADLAAMRDVPPDFVMAPKMSVAHTPLIRSVLPTTPICALIETPEGVRDCWSICAAPGVAMTLFGAFDYAAFVGCTMDWESLLFARAQLAAASAAAGIHLLDAPSSDVADLDGLRTSTDRAKALGFAGRACIHPSQVSVVNDAFTPTTAEVEQARRVVAAFEASPGGAALLDGKLLERPVAEQARRILARVRS